MKRNYVTFEQAKWLKEKEFDTPVRQRWSIVENIDGDKSSFLQEEGGLFDWNNGKYPEYYSAPEQHQVVEWLRVNHGIWITPIPRLNSWIFSIVEVKTSNHDSLIDIDFYGSNAYLISKGIPTIMMSPQEAYSAAFDIIRNNNLILT